MPHIRRYEPDDAEAVLALIGGVFAEYGLTFEPAGWDADLTRIEDAYLRSGGAFWVLDQDGRVDGTVALSPCSPALCEIKRVYLHPRWRGRGWGRALVEHVLEWAAARGFRDVQLWSDVKFTRSHVMYERLGFVRHGIRRCDDADQSQEYGFVKALPVLAAVR